MGAAPKGTFGVKNFRKKFEFGMRYCASTLKSYTQMFFGNFSIFGPLCEDRKFLLRRFLLKTFEFVFQTLYYICIMQNAMNFLLSFLKTDFSK